MVENSVQSGKLPGIKSHRGARKILRYAMRQTNRRF